MSSQNPAGDSEDRSSIESVNDSVNEPGADHSAGVAENSDSSVASTEAAVDSVVPMTDEDAAKERRLQGWKPTTETKTGGTKG